MNANLQVPTGELKLALDLLPGEDGDDAARLATQLRRELLELDVAAVRPAAGVAPDGAKAGQLVHAGELVVVLGLQRHVVRAVVDVIRAWLARQQGRSATVTVDGETLAVNGVSSQDLERLIELWVDRHSA